METFYRLTLRYCFAICLLHTHIQSFRHRLLSSDLTYTTLNGTTCIKCSPGTYLLEDCQTDYTTSRCHLCPNNTYASLPNRATRCHQCSSKCESQSMVIVSDCSPTSNLICECPEGFFNKRRRSSLRINDCVRHTPCASGYGVVQDGTSLSDTACEPCRPGCTYSNRPSSGEQCKPCTHCGEFQVQQECSVTADTVCSNARKSAEPVITNNTVVIVQEPMTDIPLVLGLVIAYVVTVFFLLIIIGKLCCRRHNYYMDGYNAPMEYYNNVGSFRSSQVFRTPAPTEIGSRTSSLQTVGMPAASELGYYSHRSTSTLQYSIYEEPNGTWESDFDVILNHLSSHITTGWRSVITDLLLGVNVSPGDTEEVIDELDQYQCSMKEKVFEGLLRWKEKGGDKSNPNTLLMSLYSQELHGLVLELRKRFPFIFQSDVENDDRETNV